MANWKAIKREQPEVIGTHPNYPSLLQVIVRLSGDPPPEWQEFFANPVGVSISTSMHPPEIFGSEVTITPPDAELDRYVRHVDERIKSANERYAREILPRLIVEEQRAEQQKAEDERRLAEAREKAKNL